VRARSIKPGFFTDEDLVELPIATRMLFVGLWCAADREGRLEDRPRQLRIQLFPCDDVDVDAMLQELHDAGRVIRYVVDGCRLVQIVNFSKHQRPHVHEKVSVLPSVPKVEASTTKVEASTTKVVSCNDQGSAMHALTPDSWSLTPDSFIKHLVKSPPKNGIALTDFTSFWEIYPRKTHKGTAKKAWVKARKKVSADAIMDGLKAHLPGWKGREEFIPYPATWLNAEGWADETLLEPERTLSDYRRERAAWEEGRRV